MNGSRNDLSFKKTNVTYFVSFVDVSFEPSDMCAPFGIPSEVRNLVRDCGIGRILQGKGDRTP